MPRRSSPKGWFTVTFDDASRSQLLQSLWQGGFASESADGISVPEPMGTIPAFRMWLQRRDVCASRRMRVLCIVRTAGKAVSTTRQ